MADAALSLDEIIKKKKIKPFKKQNAGKVVKTTKGTKATVKRLGKNKPLKTNFQKKNIITDARNKIIQKKKQNMGDARERLGELARQGDARDRLNTIRKGTTGVAARIGPQGVAARLTAKGAPIKKQGLQTKKNIVKQNVTGQTRMQGKNLTRTVAGVAGRARNGATGLKTARNNIKPAANRPMAKNQRFNPRNNQTVVVIKNDRAKMNQQRMRPMKQMQVRTQHVPYQPRYQPQGMRSDMVWDTAPYPQERIYHQPRPVMVEEIRPTRLQITTPNTYRDTIYVDQYGNEVDGPIRERPVYIEQAPRPRPAPRPAQVRVRKQQPMSANMAARLEQKQPRPQQPRPQQGHKVLVTNLHPCVSGEDMEELFSTIGTIVNARMIREGVAEAVFSKEEDALRSVEVFHNRQLDGLPMNVTIVSKKSNVQRGGPQPKSVLKAARGRKY